MAKNHYISMCVKEVVKENEGERGREREAHSECWWEKEHIHTCVCMYTHTARIMLVAGYGVPI